jgi:hypothetical protein
VLLRFAAAELLHVSLWRSGIAQIAKLSPCGQHITTATPDTAEEFHRGKEKEKSGQQTI